MSATVREFEFFGIALLWDWNKNIFSSPVASDEIFSILSEALSQCHVLGFEVAHLEFHHLY